MSSRLMRTLISAAAVACSACAVLAADAPPPDAAPLMAWRLDGISSTQLGPTQPAAAWKRSAALLEAAGRLSPNEPRFPRLGALVQLHLNEIDAAIVQVRNYRKLVPADRHAQAQLIDLYAGKMETVDARLAYLRGLIDKEDLAPEIRSHVASRCAGLLLQGSRQDAIDMAKRAVELYPLAEATRQYYELSGRQQPIDARIKSLLSVLEADPNNADYLYEMAELLSGQGLTEASIDWYGAALAVIMRSGPSRPAGFHNLLINLAAAQIIAGKTANADSFLAQMLQELPLDPDAWFLKLTVMRSQPAQASNAQIIEMARNALVRRWNQIHDQILTGAPASQPATTAPAQPEAAAPATAAATMPAKVEPLETASVIAKLKGAENPQGKDLALGALGDLAGFEIYYANQPASAKPWIDAIAALSPDDPLLTRLNGWSALQSGQPDVARQLFEKIRETDPLARLGIIKADEAEKKPLDEDAARKLLTENRIGLLGAVLSEALHSTKVTPTTQPAASAISAHLAKYPKAWLTLWDPRSTRRAYDVQVDPISSNVPYGDPLLFTVTVRNAGDHDIQIAPDALLKPDLWFDGQTLGMDRHQFRGVAFDQLGGELVLRPRTSTSQVVRIDVGELRAALIGAVGNSTRVSGDAITNPLIASGGAVPGPGGISATFNRTVVHVGLPVGMQQGHKQLDAMFASASPIDRLHAGEIVAGVNRLANAKDAAPELKQLATELSVNLVKLRTDSSPAVAGWASYLVASGPSDQSAAITMEMAGSADWTTRLLSLFLPGPTQKNAATTLANDTDPTVKAAATATLELLNPPPTTQPASQPTSMPTTDPAH